MDVSQAVSVATFKLSNNTEVAFESDDSDFEAEVVLESDDDVNAGSAISLTQLESKLVNNNNEDEKVIIDDNKLPSCSNNIISPPDYKVDVVFESDGEEPEENSLLLPHLRRISNDASLHCCDKIAVSVFQQKSKSIFLETTIPPLTTTAEEVPKQQMIFCAKTAAKCSANASVTLYLGRGGRFCKLKTTINNADSYGIYWCPFPYCNKNYRKKCLLKDHLKKTHHGPFYCTECGCYFLQLPSLNRHFR